MCFLSYRYDVTDSRNTEFVIFRSLLPRSRRIEETWSFNLAVTRRVTWSVRASWSRRKRQIVRSFRASYQRRINDDSIDQIPRAVTTFSNDLSSPLRGHEFLEHEGKKFWQKALEPSTKGKRDRSTFPSGHSGGTTRAVSSGGEHREQVSNEEKERDPAGRRERKKKERGPRGVEFGWNSSGGGTGGRGPFVVMATAGFHRLIDPPRSRSSTKPQSSPRSHHCLSHHPRNDGVPSRRTHPFEHFPRDSSRSRLIA